MHICAGEDDEDRRYGLYDEFISVSEPYEVIHFSCQVEYGHAREKEEESLGLDQIADLHPEYREHPDGVYHEYGNKDCGEECKSAESRDRCIVYLTCIRHIEQLLLVRYQKNIRNDYYAE